MALLGGTASWEVGLEIKKCTLGELFMDLAGFLEDIFPFAEGFLVPDGPVGDFVVEKLNAIELGGTAIRFMKNEKDWIMTIVAEGIKFLGVQADFFAYYCSNEAGPSLLYYSTFQLNSAGPGTILLDVLGGFRVGFGDTLQDRWLRLSSRTVV